MLTTATGDRRNVRFGVNATSASTSEIKARSCHSHRRERRLRWAVCGNNFRYRAMVPGAVLRPDSAETCKFSYCTSKSAESFAWSVMSNSEI